MVQPMGNNDAPAPDSTREQLNFDDEDLSSAFEEGQLDLGNTNLLAATAFTGGQVDFSNADDDYSSIDLLQELTEALQSGSDLGHGQDPQHSFSDPMVEYESFERAQQPSLDTNGYQATYQQQTQNFDASQHTGPGNHSHGAPALAPDPGFDHSWLQPPIQPDNPLPQEAYPGYQPAQATRTSAQASAVDSTPAYIAPVQQHGSVSTATAQKSKSRKRKRHDDQQEEDPGVNKKAGGSKGDKCVQTKNRKAQDQKDRESLSRRRDEAARRIFDIASRYVPPGVDRDVFEKEKERVKRMNKEIDGNTELYIPWNSTRADLRKTGRAVPERKEEDWEER